jgi:hypothetical protein
VLLPAKFIRVTLLDSEFTAIAPAGPVTAFESSGQFFTGV